MGKSYLFGFPQVFSGGHLNGKKLFIWLSAGVFLYFDSEM